MPTHTHSYLHTLAIYIHLDSTLFKQTHNNILGLNLAIHK